MSRKNILILGGGVMQIPSIRCAKKNGWYVILADGNDRAPGIRLSDAFEHVDLKNKEGMAEAAGKWLEKKGLDGVFTAGTDFSTTVAWVSEKLGLPGIPYDTALTASDKEKMRRCFTHHAVPSPAFTVYQNTDHHPPGDAGLGFPLVVKPVDNMGARGIRRVNNSREFEYALAAALSHSRSGRVIVEEYIQGPEFSIDAIVYNGCVTICGVADRHIFFPPYFVEMGHTMPSSYPSEDLDEIVRVFTMGVKAIGITNGAAKGDIKLAPQGPVVGEIAARLSGGYMSGWTFPYHSGVDVTQAALRIAVGEPPGDLTPRHNNVSAERAIISIPGIIRKAEGSEEATKIPGINNLFSVCGDGDAVQFPENNVQKWGNVISCLKNREEAIAAAEKGCSLVSIILEPGVKETLRFLLGLDNQWAPDAYTLQDEANKIAFDNMEVSAGVPGHAGGAVLSLPRLDRENGKDWNHVPFQSGLEKVCSITGTTIVSSLAEGESPGALGKAFWRAFLRGGYQGGAWLVDTVKRLSEENGDLETFMAQWI